MTKATDSDILGFIERFTSEHGYSPSVTEIADGVGLSAKSSIACRLARLRREGKVTYSDRAARTVRVTPANGIEEGESNDATGEG